MKKDLPTYQITIQDPNSEEELGIDQIAFVKNPAIIVKGVAFSAQKKHNFSTNGVKMRVAAPALIPGEIYRNDEDGEYNVEFTTEEIEVIYKDFMSKLSQKKDLFNLEHTREVVPAYLLEALLCDTDTKLNYIKDEYGIDLPMGSMFVVSQFTDESYYNEIVKNDRVAYSIEGFLSLKLSEIIKNKNEKMEKEEMLAKIAELEAKLSAVEPKEEKEEEVSLEVSEEVVEEVKEEVAEEVAEEKVEEVVAETEEKVEEEVAVSMTEEEIAKIVDEKIEAKLAEVTDMLADMKLRLEDMKPAVEETEKVQLSAHEIRVQKALAFAKAFGVR
jgi:hypothetical protein